MGSDIVKFICSQADSENIFVPRVRKTIPPAELEKIVAQVLRAASESESDDSDFDIYTKSTNHIGDGFKRHEMVDYVYAGLQHIKWDDSASKVGSKSMMLPVTIPTYRFFRDPDTGNRDRSKKFRVRSDVKLMLEYGIDPSAFTRGGHADLSGATLMDGLQTSVDFVLHDHETTYFGLFVPDLRKYEPEKYHLLNKIGVDLFDSGYGGFVIFTPLDDIDINLNINLMEDKIDMHNVAHRLRKLGIEDESGRIDHLSLARYLDSIAEKTTINYHHNRRDKKASQVLSDNPQYGHVVGLPYNISDYPEYFINVEQMFTISRIPKKSSD